MMAVTRHNCVRLSNQQHQSADENPLCYTFAIMVDLFWLGFGALPRIFRTRRGLLLENLALRQQLAVLQRQHPKPKLGLLDKLFWVACISPQSKLHQRKCMVGESFWFEASLGWFVGGVFPGSASSQLPGNA
jgi:hypothetical protein